jgi:hypothetical protein
MDETDERQSRRPRIKGVRPAGCEWAGRSDSGIAVMWPLPRCRRRGRRAVLDAGAVGGLEGQRLSLLSRQVEAEATWIARLGDDISKWAGEGTNAMGARPTTSAAGRTGRSCRRWHKNGRPGRRSVFTSVGPPDRPRRREVDHGPRQRSTGGLRPLTRPTPGTVMVVGPYEDVWELARIRGCGSRLRSPPWSAVRSHRDPIGHPDCRVGAQLSSSRGASFPPPGPWRCGLGLCYHCPSKRNMNRINGLRPGNLPHGTYLSNFQPLFPRSCIA